MFQRIYTIGGLVNALSSSVSPQVAGALIVPAIFILRSDILSVFVGFWFCIWYNMLKGVILCYVQYAMLKLKK